MRTRFLTMQPQTLTFLRFPLPPISSLPLSLPSTDRFSELFGYFDSVPDFSLCIERFPIDRPLSKFFSDVVPEFVAFDFGDLEDFVSQKRSVNDCGDCEQEERVKNSIHGKEEKGFEILHFETPALDELLENGCVSEEKEMQIPSDALEYDTNLEVLNSGLTVAFPHDIQESIYSVNDISPENNVEHLCASEDVDLYPTKTISSSTFPILEVDEISIGNLPGLSSEDELIPFLENVETQYGEQTNDFEVGCQERVFLMDVQISEHISECCLLKPLLHVPGLDVLPEADYLYLTEASLAQAKAELHGLIDIDPTMSVQPVFFEEFKILDLESYEIFESLSISQTAIEPETSDLFQREKSFGMFEDLIVSRELAMIDDTFNSLPVPVLVDDERIWSLQVAIDDTLANLEPLAVSASDEIYLDWHLMGKDRCKCDFHASTQKLFSDIEPYSIAYHFRTDDENLLLLQFHSCGDTFGGANAQENKLNMFRDSGSTVHRQSAELELSKLPRTGSRTIGSRGEQGDTDSKGVTSAVESIPHFSDLDFFLNPRKTTISRKLDLGFETMDAGATPLGLPCLNQTGASLSADMQMQQSNIILHQVKLSDNILMLIDKFQQSYLAICGVWNTMLKETNFPDDTNLLSLSEQVLMNCMRRSSEHVSSSGDCGGNAMDFVALCAIKRMAWCLCFFGIHALHVLVNTLFQRMAGLKSLLASLQPLIEDAYKVATKVISNSHPSLALIQNILQLNIGRKWKILIVAEKVLWSPLKRLLASLDISFSEAKNPPLHHIQSGVYNMDDSSETGAGALQQTKCLLVSHEYISTSIAWSKFDVILEYGGSCDLSKVLTILPKSTGSPRLHFLKVDLDGFARAFCEGVNIAQNNHSAITMEELLNFVPVVEQCMLISQEAADTKTNSCHFPWDGNCASVGSQPFQCSASSSPDMAIIVNTQNFDKEMIISRRGTYQKILAMENKGVQVVERDLNLPVDIIVTAAMCLAWYDCKNIGKKATAPDEASSSVPLCVSNIAVNILTSLSFSFSSCVLVFEGENNFLTTIMESSDEIYAAAASLGIDLQIFFSYSSELTDEIILSCIGYARKSCRGLISKVPETETLAESFLTKFPSINPLSAHAILSTGGMLVEFLGWSKEGRIRALQKYQVPDESVDLLSVLCKYGEREDSKSGVTDCSSSVSSIPDSENFDCKFNSERKRRKCNWSFHEDVNDLGHLKPSSRHIENELYYASGTKHLDSKMSTSPQTFRKSQLLDLSFHDELCGQEHGPGAVAKINLSAAGNPNTTWISSGPYIEDQFAACTVPVKDVAFGGKEESFLTMKNKPHRDDLFGDVDQDYIGEVIDVHDRFSGGHNFNSVAKAEKFSPMERDASKIPISRQSRIARRLSFGDSAHPNFSMPVINSNTVTRDSVEEDRQLGADSYHGGVDYNFRAIGLNDLNKSLMMASPVENFRGNLSRLPSKEKDVPYYSGTPLSKAIHSGELQKGSPWTMEFLNRIREKSRSRQRSAPFVASVTPLGSGNAPKVTKRRSPSILEYYKYQGGSSARNLSCHKKQKQYAEPLNEKNSVTLLPSLTPVDKRARQTLAFATSGTGRQAKLVWSDKFSEFG